MAPAAWTKSALVRDQAPSSAPIRVQKSTGHLLLDEDSLVARERVGRLPPIPDKIGAARVEFAVEVHFTPR